MYDKINPPIALKASAYHEALLIPTRNRSVYRNIDGAVFDKEMQPIKDTFLTRTWSDGQITALPDLGNITPSEIAEEEATHIFGGYFFDHFGHFILESLARTWVVRELREVPVVWAAGGPPNHWQREILDILGIGSRLVFPDRPTRFRELIVPQPGYRIQGQFHPMQVAHLGRYQPRNNIGEMKVWLSRAGVPEVRRASKEKKIEDELRRRGWNIVHPQKLPVAEQLELFQTAGVVAGLEGSAFHGIALLDGPSAPLIILRQTRNENYAAIAAAKDITELDLFGAFTIDDRDSRDLAHPVRTAVHVDTAADHLLRAGGQEAALAAVKARWEEELDYETWRQRQAWRLPSHGRAALTRRLRRHPRLARLLRPRT